MATELRFIRHTDLVASFPAVDAYPDRAARPHGARRSIPIIRD
ncbi:hypothetical protein WME97_11900 [Sorangium sp. So ce367]